MTMVFDSSIKYNFSIENSQCRKLKINLKGFHIFSEFALGEFLKFILYLDYEFIFDINQRYNFFL